MIKIKKHDRRACCSAFLLFVFTGVLTLSVLVGALFGNPARMVRSLGGVPLMGDEVFAYNGPQDVGKLTRKRSTEAECYDYIISECKAAAEIMSTSTNTHSARANKWTALMLEARAAVYLGLRLDVVCQQVFEEDVPVFVLYALACHAVHHP